MGFQFAPVRPAGADTQVQFNDGGGFGADAGFTFDKTLGTLGVSGGLDAGGHSALGAQAARDKYDPVFPGDDAHAVLVLGETFTDPATAAADNLLISASWNPTSAPAWSPVALELYGDIPAGNTQTFANMWGIFVGISRSGNGDITGEMIGIDSSVAKEGTGTCLSMRAGRFSTTNNGSGTVAQAFGLQQVVTNAGAAICNNVHGSEYQVYNTGIGQITLAKAGVFQIVNAGAGTIPNGYGVYVAAAQNSGGGTFANNYGVYIEDQSPAGSSASFNFFSAGAATKNHFAGNVGIGTTDQFGGGAGVLALGNAATAPTGNPTAGGVLYTEAGELKFRGTSGAASILGPAQNGQTVLGSPFDITAGNGVFQATGLTVNLPAAGIYIIYANVRATMEMTGSSDGFIVVKLRNTTDAIDVAGSERTATLLNSATKMGNTIPLSHGIALAGAKTIELYVKRDGASGWTTSRIDSDADGRTVLGFVRVG